MLNLDSTVMKQFIVTKIMTLSCLFSVSILYSQSQTNNQTNNNSMVKTSEKTDEALLSELNAQFIRNFLRQDTVSHNKIIHKDFICVEGSGEIVNREDYMRNWATDFESSGYITFSYKDEVIRIFGNMALVMSKTVYTKLIDGKTIEGNSIYTDTYIKENGKWTCVQAHITPVKRK
jgi:ketosteroid isomerase-like protein